jgi:hypothetical protein
VGAPEGFGYKIAWLAIRTENTQAAADALGMTGVRSASRAEGVERHTTPGGSRGQWSS